MITVQTLSEVFTLQNIHPISVQIQKYNEEYHVDFQHLVNLETEKPISNDDVVQDGDVIGLIMLNDVNVEIEEEISMGGELYISIRWTPSHIEYGESSDSNSGYENIGIVYDNWNVESPYFYALNRNKKYNGLSVISLMLEENVRCNWPPIQHNTLITKMEKLITERLRFYDLI